MLEINFNPFPVLNTERLVLRKISMEDINALFDLRSNDEVMRYIGRPRPKGNSDIVEMINKMNETEFINILKSGNRSEAGVSVPAHGLYLTDVVYPFPVF